MDERSPLSLETADIRAFMACAAQARPDEPVMPPDDVTALRVKLIAEELTELCAAYGIALTITPPTRTDIAQDGGVIRHSVLVERCLTPDNSLEGGIKDAFDAVLDLLVVVIGTAVANGTELPERWLEVHRSNMSKFIDGHRRADGKWVKGPSYSPANLLPILQRQRDAAAAKRRQLCIEGA